LMPSTTSGRSTPLSLRSRCMYYTYGLLKAEIKMLP